MNDAIKTYKDLDVWKISCDLVELLYRITSSFPKEERFGLIDQMRRAAVSVPSNIAEGYGRWNKKEYIHFCRIAFGSFSELETQLLLSKRLGFIHEDSAHLAEQLLGRTQKMLNRLIVSLRSSLTSK